jgi:16S rRNA (uracil1498-N3)-methyltransferase
MTMQEQNGYLILVHLSNIELYFTSPEFIKNEIITLQGEEFHHVVNVMRNSVGDSLHITDGLGNIYKTEIVEITKNNLVVVIKERLTFENKAANIWFCIPILKNPDRLKFALEKCVELGVTNFILFSSKHTISKKLNPVKFQKTLLSAMKQSLRAFLPKIISTIFNEIIEFPGSKILFEQNSKNIFNGNVNTGQQVYLLFGPEGGFDKSEIDLFSSESIYSLSTNRLRSETAIIKCASLLKLS